MKYDNHWFKSSGWQDITTLQQLGYVVHESVWQYPKEAREKLCIINGTIYVAGSDKTKDISFTKLIVKDIPTKFYPIKIGIKISNWRTTIIKLRPYMILSLNDFIKMKDDLKAELLIKQKEVLDRSNIFGFTLDNIYINVMNTNFDSYECKFLESGYRRIMLEIGAEINE